MSLTRAAGPVVIHAGREYKEVGVNQLCDKGDQMIGAPLFVGNRLYIRTHRFLFCIGDKQEVLGRGPGDDREETRP